MSVIIVLVKLYCFCL